MIPTPALTLRIAREIDLVLSFLSWLPRPGVTVDMTPSGIPSLFYRWNVREHVPYLVVPPNWDTDDLALRRLIRHEMGHEWTDAYSRRMGSDPYASLGIDPVHRQRHEIAADIFARVMGETPSYPDLEPLSRPTPERVAFITRSGEMPDRTAEMVELGLDIAAFWQRTDVPDWFRTYAGNYQRWLDINVTEPLRTK